MDDPLLHSPARPYDEDNEIVGILAQEPMFPAQKTAQKRKPKSDHKLQVAICVVLHVLLILGHISLFIVYSDHYEHRFVVTFGSPTAKWLPTVVTALSQLIGTIYLAILVLVTQGLALKCDLYTRQTLTSIHDKNNAWLGLGSAVTTAWQQFSVHAAPVSVVAIALYLAGVFVLHITIPALFHVEPFNATVPNTCATKLANASFIYSAPQSYDILSVYGQFPTLGLLDNFVYDIIPTVPSGVGTTTVNASVYDIECTTVPGFHQVDLATKVDESGATVPLWYIFQMDEHTTVEVDVPYYPGIWTGSGAAVKYVAPDCNSTNAETCWLPIVVASTVPIVDSSGALPMNVWSAISPQALQPDVLVDPTTKTYAWAEISSVQLVACAVAINNIHIEVDVQTRLPVTTPSSPPVQWKNWTWPDDRKQLLQDPRLSSAQGLASVAPDSTHSAESLGVYPFNDTNTTNSASAPTFVLTNDTNGYEAVYNETRNLTFVPITQSIIDMFLREDLELVFHNQSNISLADLNMSIGRALAATYWYGRSVNYSNPHAVIESEGRVFNASLVEGQGEAMIMVSVLKERLNLSLTPLIIGVATSAGLLLLAVYLIRLPAPSRAAFNSRVVFDSAGILQLTWLLGTEPRLSCVGEPEVDELRKAGMFDVRMSEMAEEKVSSALGAEGAEEGTGDEWRGK